MIDFIYVQCGKRVQGDDALAGKLVQCPFCAASMTAPPETSSAIASAAPQARFVDGAIAEGTPPLPIEPKVALPERTPHIARRAAPYVIVALILVLAAGLFLPAVRRVRESAARTQSTNNLKMIGLAFHGFHDANKRLPFNGQAPAVARDNTSGSWAFMIFPFVDQADLFAARNDTVGVACYMCPGRGRPNMCNGRNGRGAWTDYFINPFLNDPDGRPDAPDKKRTMVGITDGTSNTIFVGHGQIRPDDYAASDVIRGFSDTIFQGGSPALCRSNRIVVNQMDHADSMPGNWGGPFPQGSLMCMGDGTVRMFPYTTPGGSIARGVCPNSMALAAYLTPTGSETVTIGCD